MPDLAQRFLCDIEFDGSKPTHLAGPPKQTASKDNIRPPRPDERGAIDQPRDTLCVAIETIALTAAIALAVILGSYLSRSPLSDRATIEAIDVKALVERIIKYESSGIPNPKNNLSSAPRAGQFLGYTRLEPARSHPRYLITAGTVKALLQRLQDTR